MQYLTELEMSEEGCIYELNSGYVVVVFACRGGPDSLYYTNDIKEARDKIGIGEAEEEPFNLELHEGDVLFDLMCEHEALTWPRFKELMAEQGFELDMSTRKVIKKED